jgi:hypothetical protein
MNYPNIHKAKLTHSSIAKFLGYKNVNAFRCSSAHKRIMRGIDEIIGQIIPRKSVCNSRYYYYNVFLYIKFIFVYFIKVNEYKY